MKFVEYKPGDKFVRVKRPMTSFKSAGEEEAHKISMKLLERYEGPYEIIRKISPVLYEETLKDQLHTMISTLTQDDWDIYLPTVQFMYNTTVSSATGYTPMLLMTGREARLPSFNHMRGVDVEMTGELMGNKFVQRMIETMRGYHDLALEHAGKNYGRMNVRVQKALEVRGIQAG